MKTSARISCVCFGRIKWGDTYFLLVTNRRRDQNGRLVLSPVGDNQSASKKTLARLISSYQALDFEQPPALRFRVPVGQVDGVCRWFSRQHGESTVKRAMLEELSSRTSVLTPSDIGATTIRRAHIVRFDADTHRRVPGDPRTAYLVRVYDVYPDDNAMMKLVAASQFGDLPSTPRVYFATSQEIRKGNLRGLNAAEISPITTTLLR